jgi:hypothetical protein
MTAAHAPAPEEDVEMVPVVVGSEAHKRLFCQEFIETHANYRPEDIDWPDIDAETRARLAGLPVWNEAVNTERSTARKVQRMAELEADPLMREAIGLQGYEEERHARLLDLMTERYGIAVEREADRPSTVDPRWAFVRTEYGECMDAFFAFGLFKIASDSGFFPPPLVKLFDPVMQEEARHVLFFMNWIAYRRTHLQSDLRCLLDLRRGLAVALQLLSRVRTAVSISRNDQENFTMKSHASFGDFSVRRFLEVCRAENERRLGIYNAALLRPRFMPSLVNLALRVLPA